MKRQNLKGRLDPGYYRCMQYELARMQIRQQGTSEATGDFGHLLSSVSESMIGRTISSQISARMEDNLLAGCASFETSPSLSLYFFGWRSRAPYTKIRISDADSEILQFPGRNTMERYQKVPP